MNPVRRVVRWYPKQPSKRTKIKIGLLIFAFTTISGVVGTLYDSAVAKRISMVLGVFAGLLGLWVLIWEQAGDAHSPGSLPVVSPSYTSRPRQLGSRSRTVTFVGAISSFISSLVWARGIMDLPHLPRSIDSTSISVPDSGDVIQRPGTVETAIGSTSAHSIGTGTQSVEGQNIHQRKTQGVLSTSSDIYVRHLTSKGRGTPLLLPEPDQRLSVNNQRKGLMIGDVGLINQEGLGWLTLFNVTLPPDHPLAINPDKLPADFTHFDIRPGDIEHYQVFLEGSYLSSPSIECDNSSDLGFESSASEGAILTMPDGSWSEDLLNITKLRAYLSSHCVEIYRCALIQHGRVIRNGDLRVVIGHDKATTWGMAVFSKSTSQDDIIHRLKFRQGDQISGRMHSWEDSGTAEFKVGPNMREKANLRMGDPSQNDVEYRNQCLFVRTINLTLASDTWQKLLSEVGVADDD